MPLKGYKQTEEHKKKMKENNAHYWLGKKRPKEFCEKMKFVHLGKKYKLMSKIGRKNISLCHKGKKHSEETKKKISESAKKNGVGKWMKYKTGEKNPNWQGGKSFEPYTTDWKNSLRISIRERDNYICQICGEKQGDIAHCVHHIDYNKANCNSDNLITLCHDCHIETNCKREYWIEYFKRS